MIRGSATAPGFHICPMCREVSEHGLCESCKIDAAEAKRARRRKDPDPLRPVDAESVDERLRAGVRLLSIDRDSREFGLPWMQFIPEGAAI